MRENHRTVRRAGRVISFSRPLSNQERQCVGVHLPMSTLATAAVSGLLERLFAAADQNDPAGFGRARDAMARLGQPPSDRERAELMRDVYMPVSPDVGRLLYLLTRGRNAGIVVEFGTSYGISGIHLAAALRDAGRGQLITTEFDAVKAERAAENFRTAGLADLIEIRVGDAFETLKTGIQGGIDLVLLDGWKPLYLRMLKFLEPRLAPGALIVADDLAVAPEALQVLFGLCARAEERLCVGRGSARRPARGLGAGSMSYARTIGRGLRCRGKETRPSQSPPAATTNLRNPSRETGHGR